MKIRSLPDPHEPDWRWCMINGKRVLTMGANHAASYMVAEDGWPAATPERQLLWIELTLDPYARTE